jgi:dipeptidyl aminopeptidase/acylaminoacyl peptidase
MIPRTSRRRAGRVLNLNYRLGLWLSVSIVLAATLVAIGLPFASSQAQPLRLADIFVPSDTMEVTASPDGRFVAYLERTNDLAPIDLEATDTVFGRRYALMVVDLSESGEPQPREFPLPGNYPHRLQWANETTLLVGSVTAVSVHDESLTEGLVGHYWRWLVLEVESGRSFPVFGEVGAWHMGGRSPSTRIVDILPGDPQNVLVSAPSEDSYDLWRVNLATGQGQGLLSGAPDTVVWYTDQSGNPSLRIDYDSDAEVVTLFRQLEDDDTWANLENISIDIYVDRLRRWSETIWIANAETDDVVLVGARPEGRSRRGIYQFDLENDVLGELVYEHPTHDVDGGVTDTVTGRLLAAEVIDWRYRAYFLDPRLQRHYEALAAFFGEDVTVHPVDMQAETMIVRLEGPQEMGAYYAYDIAQGRVLPIGLENIRLAPERLRPMQHRRVRTRDGRMMDVYLTLPADSGQPAPLIVLPHGGPEARDAFQFEFLAQYFATRGYAVLQPNFRGSSGYGHDFASAGYEQWAGRMSDDVSDAYHAIARTGLVDASRSCIVGWSYGGYAALAAAMRQEPQYQCAVSIAGIADLPAFLNYKRDQDQDAYEYWVTSMGELERDEAALIAASPARQASRITIPVMLIHGTADEVVPIDQSERMEAAMAAVGGDVRFHLMLETGHNITNDDRLRRALDRVTGFLDTHLAERLEELGDYSEN